MTLYRRIKFCLELHNEAVKALTYPKKEVKSEKIPEKKESVIAEDVVDFLREDFD
jgi:hypothetical protein